MTVPSPPPPPPAAGSPFRRGMVAAIPLVLGYFPIAFSFGVAAIRAGLSPAETVMFSVVIFAGAAQFLALALLSGGAPLVVAALTLGAMNLRHLVYCPVLLQAAGAQARTRHSWAWGWCLTDEVFGATLGAMARGERFSEAFIGGLGLCAYAAWVAGTAVGALAGGDALRAWPALDAALGFMLPALFLALLLSILDRRQIPAGAVAALATVAGALFGSLTLGILAGIAAGALAGALRTGAARAEGAADSAGGSAAGGRAASAVAPGIGAAEALAPRESTQGGAVAGGAVASSGTPRAGTSGAGASVGNASPDPFSPGPLPTRTLLPGAPPPDPLPTRAPPPGTPPVEASTAALPAGPLSAGASRDDGPAHGRPRGERPDRRRG